MRVLTIVIMFFFVYSASIAQDTKTTHGEIRVVGESSDVPGYILNDVVIQADNSEYLKKYRNTKYFVRRVYEYSQLASVMLNEYESSLAEITSKRAKKKYLKKANKELKAEFGEEIKEMSVTRGKFLNKLIYRETGLSTYDIIRDYRGGVKAVFWQSLCRLNGQDLKVAYDAEGEDAIIERVIHEIEQGKIKTFPRAAVTQKGKDIQKRKKKRKKRKNKDSQLALK